MLQVQGRSDLYLVLEIVKKIILLVPLMIGAFVGIMPMLYVNVAVGVLTYFLNSYYSGKQLGYSSWMQIKDIAPSYGVAIAVALSVWFFKYLPISNWIILPLQLILGLIVFFFLCRIFKLEEYYESKKILMPIFTKIKRH